MSLTTVKTTSLNATEQMMKIFKSILNKVTSAILLPVFGITMFLLLWSTTAQNIHTSLGDFPGPNAVVKQFSILYQEHVAERNKADAFYQRLDKRNMAKLASNPNYVAKVRSYTGKETFLDQIMTSLITVTSGFLVAAIIAIPLGIAMGLSKNFNAAVNPMVQIFKPVSPLAWLPLVTMVVSALYVSDDPMVSKSFVTSLITVSLCSLWPMVINTSMGVASIDKDLLNVSQVLRLSTFTHIQKIVIPASVPMIFAGMRLSFGVAWMVLIAAEMLAQNPGLGKFVWDEFQNGSSDSLARIMAAVIVIGFIGFLLDRIMLKFQRKVSWDKSSVSV
ncbi:MAG: nitrate/nitrite transport system permease protein [Alteromonadaceae bacterium]|jgi:nitrate/nitrite transport system permease protein|tara:strand:+ start:846 stop:1844 length:999 start_codon:yes stop_codon:yes gene_type:complete